IEEFQDTLYKVSINNKWGIISPSGNWLLQPIYDGIILFKEDYSNNYSKINNKCSVIKYSTLNRFFSDNSIYYNIECYKVWLKDKCGLIDFYGNWLLQPIYDDIYFRIELIKDSFKEIYFIAELNEKLGIINHQGGWVMQPIYEYIYLERKYYLLKHNDRWGFMDFEGNWIVQAVYEDIAPGCKEDFYLAQLNKRWGFVNAQGTWIVQPQFDNISSFDLLDVINNEHYKVNLNGKLGVIDTSGNWIMQPTLEYIGAFDGYYKAKLLSGKWGVADVRGSWIVNPIIDFIGPSQKGFAPALMNDRWGIISNQGFWLVKPQYEDIHDNDITEDVFSHVGHYQVKQNGKWGIVNLKGICVIEPKFDAVEIYYDGYSTRFYKVKSNGKYGYLNSDFNLQIPLKFDCEAPKLSEYKPVKKTSTVDRIYKVTRNIFFVWLALSCYNIFILKIKPIDVANYYLFGINSPLIRDPEYYDENYYSDYKNYSLVDSTNNYESDGEDGNVYEEFQYTENDKIDSLVSSFDLKLSKEDINTIKNIYYGNNTDPENKRGSECGVESKNCKWCGKEFYLKKYFYTYNDLAKMMIDDFSANLVMALVKSFNEESDEIEKILHEMCENFRNGERYDCLVEIGTNEDFCSRKCQRENN
ncbi:MAG TPA: hypothetical protein DCQ29_00280, partial [Chitinophagaceae bacterium]|nr:hypothetical protein [Chitinophagaceae bacterium]